MSSEASGVQTQSDDEQTLHRLGYAQVLYREMGGFANFAISFTIISILAGCLTSYYIAFQWGGPVAITWGWLLVGGACILVALAMGEIASTYPDRRRALLLGVEARQPGVGLVHRLVQPRRADRGHRGDRLRRGDLHHVAAEPLVPGAPEHAARDLRHVHRDHRARTSLINLLGVKLLAGLNTISAWWHMAGVALIVARS